MLAPLIHAHSGSQLPDLGVHVPELETYFESNLQSIQHSPPAHEIIVSVGHGVQTKSKQLKSPPDIVAILVIAFCFNLVSINRSINFSPQRNLLIPSSTSITPQSPRAPPSIIAI